uniref:Fungal lipase-like domain-containing protein n=1 Tax=Acrobeloides nanus TaxID=290746 RepID=A0A914CHY4_9BILA
MMGAIGTGSKVRVEENATLTFDPVPMAGVGKVNYYFYHAFQRLWTNMSRDVTNVANGNANIYIVGHSLDGSLASVLAAYLASALNVASNRLTLVTFGQPRTGDTDFASFITSHVDTRYRVVNDKDQVPHSILKGWENYEHFGEEIWLIQSQSSIQIFSYS